VTSISTHVLDIERGQPAVGVSIALFRGQQCLAERQTNADGRVADLAGAQVAPGIYRLEFDVAGYFVALGNPSPFLRRVSLEFEVQETDPHCHLPLLLSAYACTSYRGS
jgi:5-hydroxyisourate hydrolase